MPPASSIADAIRHPPGIPHKERAVRALNSSSPMGWGEPDQIRFGEREKTEGPKGSRFYSSALRGAFAPPQSPQRRRFEGGELVQALFGKKTAPGASSCVLARGFGRRHGLGRGGNRGLSNKLD
jgi:hypothetical protein